MIDILRIILCVLIGCLASLTAHAIKREHIRFNDGKCIGCETELRHFTTGSSGSRGYKCDNCNFITWVSYKCVDKRYRMQKEEDLEHES